MIGGGEHALPTETTPMKIKLATPIRAGRDWIEEVTFQWLMDEGTVRIYRGSGGQNMEVARFYATTVPDLGFTIDTGIVTNARSKFIKRAVEQIAAAASRLIATMLVYGEEGEHNGIGWPLNAELMKTGDGTIRPRGFAGIVRAMEPEFVATTDVEFPQYFAEGGGGGWD